ncbi:hypothetical protein E4T48_00861 [Aureobasidium sp. EXF-10727]|nr:hypothetical protein E4T48_00861 [Aureobasidium sp. EXF-10727]KAI4730727.1 hypothetical protein E4T49_01556 [Aureobasidium sp. EXF-10728]
MFHLIKFLTIAALSKTALAFTNPIITGVNADPSAIRVGDDYFLVSSSFEYFPGIPVYHSTNLVDWTLIGHGLNDNNKIQDRRLLTTGGIFAPTIRHHNGTFYIITTYADNFLPWQQNNFIITTDDPFSNNWTQPMYLDQAGIDPDLFWDNDGTVYLSTGYPEFGLQGGNSTIYQSKLDLETGHSLTQPGLIYRSSLPEEIRWAEGPHVYYINGSYYLSVAEGGTEVLHRQTIHRGPSPSGPWEASPLGPMVFNSRDPSAPIQQTGHADLVQRPDGKWYTVFLANRPQLPQNINGTYQLGRETFLSSVTWSQDGWPLANHGNLITFDMQDPDLPAQANASKILRDDFSGSSLRLGWEFRGTPSRRWWRVEDNSLVLRGTTATLSDLDNVALVLRKQDALFYTFGVDMVFNPTLPTHEAGIVAWVNDHYHNTVSVVLCRDDTNSTCLKTMTTEGDRLGDEDGNTTIVYYPLPSAQFGNSSHGATVRLSIRTTPETYQLGYSLSEDDATTWLTAYTALWMAPHYEGRISWQGARMGMYSTGNGVTMLQEAIFKDVEIVRGPY